VRSFLPADRAATDAALASGRTLAEVAPGSPLRAGLRTLAAALARVPEPATGRRGLRRRRAG
jgi:Flp pilus assembly CpaE family ATPase